MAAVENNQEFMLRWPVDAVIPKFTRKVVARDVWNLLIKAATNFAEPGLLFWDTIKNNLPANCYEGFKVITTNPCGELPLSGGGACRLISNNFKGFVKNRFMKDAHFDYELFEKMIRMAQRLSDDLVDLEIEKIEGIIKTLDDESELRLWNKMLANCKNGRETGLGIYALADALACLNLRYDSDEAVAEVEKMFSTLKNAAYMESVCMAEERGAFPLWNCDVEKDNAFIKGLSSDVVERMKKSGRRNISLMTIAPTGSVSILSQTSSGIEPVFRNSYTRKRKIGQSEVNENAHVDQLGDKWITFDVVHKNIEEWQQLSREKEIPDLFVTSDSIDWQKRLEVQAAAQKHIDHSISNTINLPKGTKEELVSDIYFAAWKKGLKGITVYVDGSREGVLVTKETASTKKEPGRDAPKRPDELDCAIHHVSVKGQKWLILVGLLNGRPYEIFGGVEEKIEIPKKFTSGKIVKVEEKGGNRYDLKFGEDGCIKDIGKMFDNTNYQVHTRLISLGLRHGAKVNFVVEQLQKDADNDFTSFSRAISRVLKKYIEDGTKVATDKTCGNCGQDTLFYSEGCVNCSNCAWTKCS
jgi:ribonucleoside-diphosphate reductase alpha chain